MRRTPMISTMALIVAVPLLGAGTLLLKRDGGVATRPCFAAGNAGYALSTEATARHVVRIDADPAQVNLRMQIVDDPAAADFVLVDDGDAASACRDVSFIDSVRIDPDAAQPDLTVAMTTGAADARIYVNSSRFTAREAAALFAVIWQRGNTTGSIARTAH